MDALVMCGGRGTRLETDREKPLYEVGGRPMMDRVLDALAASRVEAVRAVGSPHTPRTREHLTGRAVEYVEAPGDGYVSDLQYVLDRLEPPVLTVAADLPLLAGDAVDDVLESHQGGSLTVCVPVALKRRLGVSVETAFERDGRSLAPAGVNVVGAADTEAIHMTKDTRLAVNVNRLTDAAVAEALL